jgi:hypothetical protein
MDNDMIFWDDMWNEDNSDKSKCKEVECCGDWDEFGICNCKKDSK